jgi:Rrf2 family cysteine metabolism transcriptional repressor
MKISKKSQYGLRAMVYLAKASQEKKICPLKEISKAEGIPFDFLEKIFSELEKAGLVEAKKGAQGGYFLAKKPGEITAGEVVRVLEETVPVGCAGCARARTCLTKSVWSQLQDTLDSTLDSITLADLAKK